MSVYFKSSIPCHLQASICQIFLSKTAVVKRGLEGFEKGVGVEHIGKTGGQFKRGYKTLSELWLLLSK